jgi:hypothetical protein
MDFPLLFLIGNFFFSISAGNFSQLKGKKSEFLFIFLFSFDSGSLNGVNIEKKMKKRKNDGKFMFMFILGIYLKSDLKAINPCFYLSFLTFFLFFCFVSGGFGLEKCHLTSIILARFLFGFVWNFLEIAFKDNSFKKVYFFHIF